MTDQGSNSITVPSETAPTLPWSESTSPAAEHYFTLDLASREIGKLAEAMAAAQGEFGPVEKDRTVDVRYWDKSTNSYTTRTRRYATLDSVLRAVRPALSKHGLALMQRGISAPAGAHGMETLLLHASGQWIGQQSFLALADKQEGPQAIGATITYHRRYALGAFLAVAPEEDTDAEPEPSDAPADAKHPPQPRNRKETARNAGEVVAAQVAAKREEATQAAADPRLAANRRLYAIMKEAGLTGEKDETADRTHQLAANFLGRGVSSLTQLEPRKIHDLASWIESNRAEAFGILGLDPFEEGENG